MNGEQPDIPEKAPAKPFETDFLRKQIMEELDSKYGLRVEEKLTEKVVERLAQRKLVQLAAEEAIASYFGRVWKIATVVVTVILTIAGLLGYTQLRSLLDSRAGEQVSKKFDEEKLLLKEAKDQFQERADKLIIRHEERMDRLNDRQQEVLEAQITQMKKSLIEEKQRFENEIYVFLSQQKETNFAQSLRLEAGNLRLALNQEANTQIRLVQDAGKRERDEIREAGKSVRMQPASAADDDAGPRAGIGASHIGRTGAQADDGISDGYLMALAALRARDYKGGIELARQLLQDGEFSLAKSLASPLSVNPGRFDEDELQVAMEALLHPRQTLMERFGSAGEMVISGTINNVPALREAGWSAYTNNPTRTIAPSEIAEFAHAIAVGQPKAELQKLAEQVDLDGLTAVGLANMSLLVKAADVSAPPQRVIRAKMLEAYAEPDMIEGPSDYALLARFVSAVKGTLAETPGPDSGEVADLIQRFEGIVFPEGVAGESLRDPWELQSEMRQILAKLGLRPNEASAVPVAPKAPNN